MAMRSTTPELTECGQKARQQLAEWMSHPRQEPKLTASPQKRKRGRDIKSNPLQI